jgi:hypothetical protein
LFLLNWQLPHWFPGVDSGLNRIPHSPEVGSEGMVICGM